MCCQFQLLRNGQANRVFSYPTETKIVRAVAILLTWLLAVYSSAGFDSSPSPMLNLLFYFFSFCFAYRDEEAFPLDFLSPGR